MNRAARSHRRRRLFRWTVLSALAVGFGLAHAAPPPTEATSVLDEPLRLIALARRAYARLDDYTCTLIKRERLEGRDGLSESVIHMMVRTRPFRINLRWQEPRDLAGQEACYVEGGNNGKMRVRASGLLGAVGFVTLDLDDARARKNSRHSINEAGLGNLIERYASRWEEEKRTGRTEVHIAAYEYNKRRCTRVETVHPGEPDSRFAFYRSVVYFDQESNLPMRVECYDWPRSPTDKGQAVEVYSYVNLRVNVGLGDEPFSK
jgi:hypothetical protein